MERYKRLEYPDGEVTWLVCYNPLGYTRTNSTLSWNEFCPLPTLSAMFALLDAAYVKEEGRPPRAGIDGVGVVYDGEVWRGAGDSRVRMRGRWYYIDENHVEGE